MGIENNQKEFRLQIFLPQVQSRKQEIQQALAKLTPMKKVERTNVVVVRNLLQEQEEMGEGMRRNERESLCNGCEQGKKFLQLWEIWPSHVELQELENSGPREKN